MSFTFIDLFAGIGGFHGGLTALGGKAVYASEIDKDAVAVYESMWGLAPDGDITLAASESAMLVPPHDILTGGFPCQPFSKSGKQKGMDEARGTLFWNIAKIIEKRRPKVVLLENVRNLAGPRHEHEWDVIIRTLREFGYRVSSEPLVVSPHKIAPRFGGRPQVRERIYIGATFVGNENLVTAFDEPAQLDLTPVMSGWDPSNWDLAKHLPLEDLSEGESSSVALNVNEVTWIEAWDDFVKTILKQTGGKPLPGFPIWADAWELSSELRIPDGTPAWKANFLVKNAEFYTLHQTALDAWLQRWNNLAGFPPSRRKLEWQAQDAKSLWECIMHFRPSGIRAKKATYVPALVAITQTSVIGPQRRKMTVRECARLQSFPDAFSFGEQSDSASYKQLGNGVNLSVVYQVLKALIERDQDLLTNEKDPRKLKQNKALLKAVQAAPANADTAISKLRFGKKKT